MRKKKGGFGVVYQDVARNNSIPPAAKGLYCYMASIAGNTDECYPTVELMRHEMGMSKDSFYKHMNILIATGVVEKTQIKTEECRFGRNVYKLTHRVHISEKPSTEIPATVLPTAEKPTTELKDTNKNSLNNNSLNNNNTNKQCAPSDAQSASKKAANEFFESIWQLYPNKKGKGQISDTKKKVLYSIGFDELSRAIERYKAGLEKDEWRKPQNGSTFFNSGYVDYLDDNYTDSIQTGNVGGDAGYDMDYLDATMEQIMKEGKKIDGPFK